MISHVYKSKDKVKNLTECNLSITIVNTGGKGKFEGHYRQLSDWTRHMMMSHAYAPTIS